MPPFFHSTRLPQDVQLASYSVHEFSFHNAGNGNTGDMFFVLSSASAERFACLPRFLLSMVHYGSLGPHSTVRHHRGLRDSGRALT